MAGSKVDHEHTESDLLARIGRRTNFVGFFDNPCEDTLWLGNLVVGVGRIEVVVYKPLRFVNYRIQQPTHGYYVAPVRVSDHRCEDTDGDG